MPQTQHNTLEHTNTTRKTLNVNLMPTCYRKQAKAAQTTHQNHI
jgi:hypothetical protein